jgi:hypothetical protein
MGKFKDALKKVAKGAVKVVKFAAPIAAGLIPGGAAVTGLIKSGILPKLVSKIAPVLLKGKSIAGAVSVASAGVFKVNSQPASGFAPVLSRSAALLPENRTGLLTDNSIVANDMGEVVMVGSGSPTSSVNPVALYPKEKMSMAAMLGLGLGALLLLKVMKVI